MRRMPLVRRVRPVMPPRRSPRWSGTRRMRRLERPPGGGVGARAPAGTERPAPPDPDARPVPGTWLPSVPGILTADQILATGDSIAAVQQRDGAIGWPDGHVDAWN